MYWFQFGRTKGFPTIYDANKTIVTVNVIQVIIYFSFFIVALAFLLIIPGYGRKKSIYIIVKAIISILIGCSLMIANFGQEWEVGNVISRVPYRAGEKLEFTAYIGIKIGLRSINITLSDETPGNVRYHLNNESLKYNEEFSWTWDQGKFDYDSNVNLVVNIRQAQKKGLPITFIWILNYFCIDGGGMRYGRFYRMTGWYCNILLWSAFPAWILVNIFSQSIGRYTAYIIGIIGTLEITSCIIWISNRNPSPLIIRFPDGDMTLSFGSSFWLTCIGGVLCLLLTFAIIIMDLRYPNTLSAFLGIDILDQYDECVIQTIELDNMAERKNDIEIIELEKVTGQISAKDSNVVFLKRRSTIKRAQKNLVHVSAVSMAIHNFNDDTALYVNELNQAGTSSRNNGSAIKFKPPIPKRNVV